MAILGLTCIAITVVFVRYDREREKSVDQERQQWLDERQKLLDRIQAPSFDHLKQAEIRLEKVKNEPKETIKLEVV